MSINLDKDLSNAYIDLSFGPTWPYVRVVREFIESFCRVSFGDLDFNISERISSSASELVENAVKYSTKDDIKHGTRVKVELIQKRELVVLEVQNLAPDNHINMLKAHLAQLSKLKPDALQDLYREKMLKASEDGSTSQLGLIRILWEWQAESLEMEIVSDKNTHHKRKKVAVRALFKLRRARP